MKTTLAAVVLAVAGAAMAPAARAHDDFGLSVGRVRVSVTTGGHARACVFRPARWEERIQRVVVREGYWRCVVTPAAFEIRWSWSARRFVRVCVRPERVSRTWVPPVVEERRVRVLVPGGWDCCCRNEF